MRAVQIVADLHVYRSQVVAKTSLKLATEHTCTLTVLVCLTVCIVKLTMVLR